MSTPLRGHTWHVPTDGLGSEDSCNSDASCIGDEACSSQFRAENATAFSLIGIVSGSLALQSQLSISPTGSSRSSAVESWSHLCGLPCSKQLGCAAPSSGSIQSMDVDEGWRPCPVTGEGSPRTPVGMFNQGPFVAQWPSFFWEFVPEMGRDVQMPKPATGFSYHVTSCQLASDAGVDAVP